MENGSQVSKGNLSYVIDIYIYTYVCIYVYVYVYIDISINALFLQGETTRFAAVDWRIILVYPSAASLVSPQMINYIM